MIEDSDANTSFDQYDTVLVLPFKLFAGAVLATEKLRLNAEACPVLMAFSGTVRKTNRSPVSKFTWLRLSCCSPMLLYVRGKEGKGPLRESMCFWHRASPSDMAALYGYLLHACDSMEMG